MSILPDRNIMFSEISPVLESIESGLKQGDTETFWYDAEKPAVDLTRTYEEIKVQEREQLVSLYSKRPEIVESLCENVEGDQNDGFVRTEENPLREREIEHYAQRRWEAYQQEIEESKRRLTREDVEQLEETMKIAGIIPTDATFVRGKIYARRQSRLFEFEIGVRDIIFRSDPDKYTATANECYSRLFQNAQYSIYLINNEDESGNPMRSITVEGGIATRDMFVQSVSEYRETYSDAYYQERRKVYDDCVELNKRRDAYSEANTFQYEDVEVAKRIKQILESRR